MAKITVPLQFRVATFSPDQINVEERTVPVSFSSETPVFRRYKMDGGKREVSGNEILHHDPESIDLSRCVSGSLPLLWMHDETQHIGVVENVRFQGARGVGVARFSRSPLGEQKFQDVKDGILKDTSVGYRVDDMEHVIVKEGDKKRNEFHARKWTPFEVTMTPMGADISVGAYRTAEGIAQENEIELRNFVDEDKETRSKESTVQIMEEVIDAEALEKATRNASEAGVNTERSRISKISELGATLQGKRKVDMSGIVADAIKEGKSFDDFRQTALEYAYGEDAKPIDLARSVEIGMSKKDLKNFSLVKAMRDIRDHKELRGLEKEACDAAAKQYERTHANSLGFTIPEDWSMRGLQEMHGLGDAAARDYRQGVMDIAIAQGRALNVTSGPLGGYTVATDLLGGSLIELLRNKALVMSLGPTHLTGLVGNIAIPRQSGGATCYWLSETATVPESDQQFQQLGLSPHRLVADTAYSKELLNQSSISIEAFVRDDIARQMAVAKDYAQIAGTGTNGQPLGILNTPNVLTETFSGAPTWAKIVDFETKLAQANADQLGMPVWLTTPGVRGSWKTTPKISGTNASFPIYLWEDGYVNGYRGEVTNNVPSNLVIFGIFSQLIVADWAGIDVVVDPYSLKKSNQIETTVTSWTDNNLRHEPAFVVSTDAGNQ